MPSAPLLTIFKGLSSQLGSASSEASKLTHDGRLYLTTDDGYLYYDIPNSDGLYGAPVSSSVRKAINAKYALSAGHVANTLTVYVNNNSSAAAAYNGGVATNLYIGTDLIVAGVATSLSFGATTSADNKVYVNLLTLNGSSSTYTKKAGFSLTGLGDVKVYNDVNGNITIQDVTYSATAGLTMGQDHSIGHSNTAISPGTIGDTQQSGANRTLLYGGKFDIPKITYDVYGHITSVAKTTLTLPAQVGVFTSNSGATAGSNGLVPGPAGNTSSLAFLCADGTWKNPDTHYITHLFINGGTASDSHTSGAIANGNVYLRLYDFYNTEHTLRESIKIEGAGSVSVTIDGTKTSGTNGTITITGVNTTYAAGSGITIEGANNTVRHTNVLSGSGTLTPTINGSAINTTTNKMVTVNGYMDFPVVNYDINGHFVSSSTVRINIPNTFKAATDSVDGEAGFVPAPSRGDQAGKFLKADGTWSIPQGQNTHYANGLWVTGITASQSNTATVNNGDVYLRFYNDSTLAASVKLIGAGGTQVVVNSAGNVTFQSPSYTFTLGTNSGLTLTPTVSGLSQTYTFSHSNQSVSTSTTNDVSESIVTRSGNSIDIPIIGYDVNGHITSFNKRTISFPTMVGASQSAGGKLGLVPAPPQTDTSNTVKYLDSTAQWSIPADTHYITSVYVNNSPSATTNGASLTNGNVYVNFCDMYNNTKQGNGSYLNIIGRAGTSGSKGECADGTGITVSYRNNTIYIDGHVFTVASSTTVGGVPGLVPAPSGSEYNDPSKFLNAMGGWAVPPDTQYTFTSSTGGAYNASTNPGATAGYVSALVDAKYNLLVSQFELENVNETTGLSQVGFAMSDIEVDTIFDEVFGTSYAQAASGGNS